MISISDEYFEKLLPHAVRWAEAQEQYILEHGVPLNDIQLEDARKIGVQHPEKVRLFRTNAIPSPEEPELRKVADATGLLAEGTIGVTFRYGIYIQIDHWGMRRLVAHELVHTMQYERLGGFTQFLEQYLYECIKVGYPLGALEQEARKMEKDFL